MSEDPSTIWLAATHHQPDLSLNIKNHRHPCWRRGQLLRRTGRSNVTNLQAPWPHYSRSTNTTATPAAMVAIPVPAAVTRAPMSVTGCNSTPSPPLHAKNCHHPVGHPCRPSSALRSTPIPSCFARSHLINHSTHPDPHRSQQQRQVPAASHHREKWSSRWRRARRWMCNSIGWCRKRRCAGWPMRMDDGVRQLYRRHCLTGVPCKRWIVISLRRNSMWWTTWRPISPSVLHRHRRTVGYCRRSRVPMFRCNRWSIIAASCGMYHVSDYTISHGPWRSDWPMHWDFFKLIYRLN